jgi:hypothetical protein
VFFLGHGFTNMMIDERASHSTVIQIFYQFGLLGVPVLIYWIVSFFRINTQGANVGKVFRLRYLMIYAGVFGPWLALDLLFFDEPSAGLDPVSSAELDRLILKLREHAGATIVVITHELDSIFAIGDRALMLDKARRTLVADDTPENLLKKSADPWVKNFMNRGGLGCKRSFIDHE